MASSPHVTSYLNTLIFAIVAKFVSIILLILLFVSSAFSRFSYAIITIEIGLLLIIVNSITSIVRYSKRMEEASRKNLTTSIQVGACPDFFTRTTGNTCKATYTTSDKRHKYYIGEVNNLEINMDQEFKASSADQTCTKVNTRFANIPWTDLRSRCDMNG